MHTSQDLSTTLPFWFYSLLPLISGQSNFSFLGAGITSKQPIVQCCLQIHSGSPRSWNTEKKGLRFSLKPILYFASSWAACHLWTHSHPQMNTTVFILYSPLKIQRAPRWEGSSNLKLVTGRAGILGPGCSSHGWLVTVTGKAVLPLFSPIRSAQHLLQI